MNEIHAHATVSSKGQITLPKAIRQALGVSTGEKLAFKLRSGEVLVSRDDSADHDDPAIGAFLNFLEDDIRTGRRIGNLPDDVVQSMLANMATPVASSDEEIEGDVAL